MEKEPHYEDIEPDTELKKMVPMLRRITIQREIDEKRSTEMKRQAKLHREMLEKQNKNLSKNKNIADMNITFDDKPAPRAAKHKD